MGMPGSEVAAVYRLHAANCTEIAQRVSEPKNKTVLLRMAAAWLRLAELAEKNSRVILVRETAEQRQQVTQHQLEPDRSEKD